MTMQDPQQREPGAHQYLPLPGAGAVAIAAIATAVATVLPWFQVDFSKMGGSFPFGAGLNEAGTMLGNLMGQMAGAPVMTVKAIEGWLGKVILVAALVTAVMALVETTAAQAVSQAKLMLGSFLAGLTCLGLTIFACTDLGGPIGIQFGLVVAVLASIALSVLTYRRLQDFGVLRYAELHRVQ